MHQSMVDASHVGTIYGDATAHRFTLALSDGSLARLAYIQVEHGGQWVLCQVQEVRRHASMGFDEALNVAEEPNHHPSADKLSADVAVIGWMDERGRVQLPRTPFAPGQPAYAADPGLVRAVLGLDAGHDGAFLGKIKGGQLNVNLGMNVLAQKHLCVLAKTGAGKSYTVGVILEEFLKAKVPLVILDPHGEYGSLRSPNLSEGDIEDMARFAIKPKAFQSQVQEFAVDTTANPDAKRLLLEGLNLEGREIADLVPGKLPSSQLGLLYQAVKETAEQLPAYGLEDVREAVSLAKSNAKWNVVAALDALLATGLFAVKGTSVADLVQPGRCTIINLRGVPPELQEVVATRISQLLWEERKLANIPPHILVVEEAHNFCPERGVGHALSTGIIRTIASEGRKFGLGLAIISQRPAKIDKNVLSQCNTQIILKLTNPNDLKAVTASIEGITSDAADEIQRLPVGTALVSGGGLTRPVYVDVRPRQSRHGGMSVDVVGAPGLGGNAVPKRAAKQHTPKPSLEVPNTPQHSEPDMLTVLPSVPASSARVAALEDDTRGAAEDLLRESTATEVTPVSFLDGPHHARGRPEDEAKAAVTDIEPPTVTFVAREPIERAQEPLRPSALASAPTPPSPAMASSPNVQGSAAKAMPAPTPIPPAKPPTAAETQSIHRVATRLGIVEGHSPAATLELLRAAHERAGKDANAHLRDLAEIATTACHEDQPACIRCPMAGRCHYHAMLQQSRRQARSSIRRLWRK